MTKQPDILFVICPTWSIYNPSIGVGYLCSYLKSKKVFPKVMDINIEIYNKIPEKHKNIWNIKTILRWDNLSILENYLVKYANKIIETGIKIVAFSIMASNQVFSLSLIKLLKQKNPNLIIITGGSQSALENSNFIDYAVLSEPEETLYKLVYAIKNKKNTKKFKGIRIYKKEGFIDTPKREPLNLNSLPFPTYEEFDLSLYTRKTLGISGSRGCIQKCHFCNDWVVWGFYRSRNPALIIDEIKYHLNNYKITNFEFSDLLLNASVKNLERFCDLLIEYGLKISWNGNSIIRKEMTLDLLKKMKKAGCSGLIYGLEGGSEKIIKKMGKNFTMNEANIVLKNTSKAGIHVSLNLMVGFPGETKKDFQKTIEFIEKNHKYINNISGVATCFVIGNSTLEKNPEKFNLKISMNNHWYKWYDNKGNNYEMRMKRSDELAELIKKYKIPITEIKRIEERTPNSKQNSKIKVLLANMPWKVRDRKGVRAGSRWPHLKIPEEENYMPYPFFLGYATSLLKKNKINALGVDAIAENISYENFFDRIKEFNPGLLFVELSTPSLKHDLKLLKQIKMFSKCKIVVAGPDMNILDEKFMLENNFIDFMLIGEYEFILLELVQKLENKKKVDNVAGLVFRTTKGNVIKNNRRNLESNLENYPWPDRNDFPIFNYHDNPGGIPSPSAQMIASRGCPYNCTFCAWPQLVYGGRNYRTRSVKDVVDEMEYLVIENGFKSIYFDDDTFNIGKKRMLEFASELKKRDWRTPWAFMGRADLVNEEVLKKLREVGLSAVKYGIESAVQEIVDNSNKGLNINLATKNILLTKKYGIKVHLTFTFGLPGETRSTIKKTIDYAIKTNPESVQFSILTPFPGTEFYEELKSKGMIITEDFDNYDGNTRSVIKTSYLNDVNLTKAQRFAYKMWHNHKGKKIRYKKNSPITLFFKCLTEHSLKYTLKHTMNYVKNKSYKFYKKK